jgi:zinc protease
MDGNAARGDARSSSELASLLLANIERDLIFTTPLQAATDAKRLAANVTIEDIHLAARSLFAGSGPLLFVSAGKAPAGGEAALSATLLRAGAAPLAQGSTRAETAWGYDPIGPAGRISDRQYIADLDVTLVHFTNGTSVTIKPAPATGQVMTDLTFGAGLAGLPVGLEQSYWLIGAGSQVFPMGGLGKADLSEIDSQLTGKTVSIQFFASEERLHLGGRTRRDSLDAELQLLTAFVADPAFRPAGLARAISAEGLVLQQAGSTPMAVMQRDLAFLLHDHDPRWQGLPTATQLAATKPADLQALLRPALAGPIDLLIVGDVDVEKAIEAARRTIGALPPRASRLPSRDTHFPASTEQPVIETVGPATEQGAAVAAWPIPSFFTGMADARAIQVLAKIVEGRLIDGLREKDGLTYAPMVLTDQSEALPGYGALIVQVEIASPKMPVFYDALGAIMRDLAGQPVSLDELARAKSPLVSDGRSLIRDPGYWLHALSGAASDPRYFETIRTRIHDLDQVTSGDVQRLARTYFATKAPYRIIAKSIGAGQ